MKPTLLAALITLFAAVSFSGNAQTLTVINITSNTSTSPYGTGAICSYCVINISAGVTLNINNAASCSQCTFNGGTVTITAPGFTLSNQTTFNNSTVLISQPFNLSNPDTLNFVGDSVAFGATQSLANGVTTITNSKVSVATGVTLTTDDTHFTGSNFTLSGSAKMTIGDSLNSKNSNYYLAGTSSINSTGFTTFSGDNIVMSGTTNSLKSTYTLAATNTNFTMNGTAGTLTASQGFNTNGGSITTATGSTINVAYVSNLTNTTVNLTGTTYTTSQGITTSGGSFKATNSTINATTSGPLSYTNTPDTLINSTMTAQQLTQTGGTLVLTNSNETLTYASTFSNAKVFLNGNSAYKTTSLTLNTNTWFAIGNGTLGTNTTSAYVKLQYGVTADATSTVAVANNNNYINSTSYTGTGNCGGAYPNACAANYLYGCATVKGSGSPVYCTVLAIASMNLSAAVAGPGQVNLTWTDNETSSADHYTIQRNSANNAWTDIGTTTAGSTTGDYYFTDPNAPSGSSDYRIQRTDADGNILYSPVASVNLTLAGSALSIHPNPAIGGHFYINTPYTGQMVVNVYTSTGQLLLHTSLQGQTQYSIQLPEQNLSMTAVVVQTISQNGNGAFTVLVR